MDVVLNSGLKYRSPNRSLLVTRSPWVTTCTRACWPFSWQDSHQVSNYIWQHSNVLTFRVKYNFASRNLYSEFFRNSQNWQCWHLCKLKLENSFRNRSSVTSILNLFTLDKIKFALKLIQLVTFSNLSLLEETLNMPMLPTFVSYAKKNSIDSLICWRNEQFTFWYIIYYDDMWHLCKSFCSFNFYWEFLAAQFWYRYNRIT